MATRINIELNEVELKRVCAELELRRPPTFTLNHSGKIDGKEIGEKGIKAIRGVYDPKTNHIEIASQSPQHRLEGLLVLTKHIRSTVLHELRHAWQREHWFAQEQIAGREGSYESRREEIDANDWAEYAMPLYRKLVVITRTFTGQSGFARMTQRAKEQIG